MRAKTPSESLTILTDLVLPGETNYLDNLFGGELLARMDRACSIAARRHSRRIVVTASVNHVAFNKSVPVGSVVTIEAKVSRAFKSSMEIYVDVWIEDRQSGSKTKVNEGRITSSPGPISNKIAVISSACVHDVVSNTFGTSNSFCNNS